MHESEQFGFIEMEYVPHGTLSDYLGQIMKTENQMDAASHDLRVSCIMGQLIDAVAQVHSNNLVHRDLKPDNILVQKIDSKSVLDGCEIKVKVADFGLAAQFKVSLSQADPLEARAGTFKYMAPEQAGPGKLYGKKIDMWACGIIMYQLLSFGQHPLLTSDDHRLDEQGFIERLRNPHWTFSDHFSEYAIDFFLRLCDPSAMNRYTAMQAL